jgi:hypothetical protein
VKGKVPKLPATIRSIEEFRIWALGCHDTKEEALRGAERRNTKWSVKDTWPNRKVGPWNRHADTCFSLKRVNNPLTFRVSRVRKIREGNPTFRLVN